MLYVANQKRYTILALPARAARAEREKTTGKVKFGAFHLSPHAPRAALDAVLRVNCTPEYKVFKRWEQEGESVGVEWTS